MEFFRKQLLEDSDIMQVDIAGCSLVVTTGGTGPALRDVTPEATEAVSSFFCLDTFCLDPSYVSMAVSKSSNCAPVGICSTVCSTIRVGSPLP